MSPSLLSVLAEGFLSRLSFGIISFALPLYAYRIGMSLSAIGILISLNVIAEMALKPFVAPLIDRFGPKRSLGFAVGIRSLVAFLLALATAPWQLFGVRLIHGASESMRDPSVNFIIADRGEKDTIASSFAWYNTAKAAAGAIGKTAAGVLLTVTLSNYALVFFIAFFLSALPLFVVMRYVKEEKTGESDSTAGAGVPAAGHSEKTGAEKSGAAGEGRRSILPSFGFGALVSGTGAMLNNLFPLLATKYAGLTEAEAGIIYGITTLVVIFAGPLFGWLSDNVSRRLVLLARGIANAVSSVLYIFFPGFAGVAAARIIDDIGKAAFRPAWGVLMSHLSGLDRTRRGRMLGYMGLAENIGETAGPLLAGFLWQAWGAVAMLTVRAGLAVVTEIYSVFVIGAIEQKADRSPADLREARTDGPGVFGVKHPLDRKEDL